MSEPHAFLSYAHSDDDFHHGAITKLRKRLEHAVRVVTGTHFRVFQDRDGIEFGKHWPERLDEALADARFLIPILTPSYFESPGCRDELEKFLKLEKAAGRKDLILPLHYVYTWQLFDDERRRVDRLVRAMSERQWHDWRDHADLDPEDPRALPALKQLASGIAQVVRAPSTAPAARPSGRSRVAPRPLTDEEKAGRLRALGEPRQVEEEEQRRGVAEAKAQFRTASDSHLVTFQIFRDVDAPWCPEMVVIPAGRFVMGSPDDEEGRNDDEGPQHEVTFARPFALGRFTVTFEEYDAFCAATGRPRLYDHWGRGRQPVGYVSWDDATAYCCWLEKQTGAPYRLPSEAEWEYAARAGTTTPFWTGATISTEQANYDGNYTYGDGVKGVYREGTVPVDALPGARNPWGLHHVHGNVWEWVEDCHHATYNRAPRDGSAWITDCRAEPRRVLRGGFWNSEPPQVRAAVRGRIAAEGHSSNIGFRVARMLAP